MRNPRRIALIATAAGALGLASGALAPLLDATVAHAGREPAAQPHSAHAAESAAELRIPASLRGRLEVFERAALSAEPIPAAGVSAGRAGEPRAETTVRTLTAEPNGWASSLPLPQLDPLAAAAGAVTASVSGWDPAAPRRLTLWRVEDGRPARLAETQSERGGRFRFSEIAKGRRELVVTTGDAAPQESDPRLYLPDPKPAPPVAQAILDAEGGSRLRVWPSASAVSVIFAAGGRELERRTVPVLPDGRDRTLDVRVAPWPAGAPIWVAEEHLGGMRSDWLRLDTKSAAEAAGTEASP